MTLSVSATKLVLAGSLLFGAGAPVTVTVDAPSHTPKINSHWNYTVRATSHGKPVVGKLSEQIVDPIGGLHPVGFGKKKGNVTNVPFKGSFSDFVVWPASSSGVPLTFRVIVVSGKTKRVVDYRVTPRG